MTRLTVHVVPGSSKPGPDGRHGELPRLRVRSQPTDGRANAEAERLLAKLYRARVSLVSGTRSRRKTFEVDVGSIEERSREIFGD